MEGRSGVTVVSLQTLERIGGITLTCEVEQSVCDAEESDGSVIAT